MTEEAKGIGVIRALTDTWIKKTTDQARALPDSQKAFVPAGTKFRIIAALPPEDGHILATISKNIANADNSSMTNTWLFGAPINHSEIWEIVEDNRFPPTEAVVAPPKSKKLIGDYFKKKPRGKIIEIPGRGKVGLLDPVFESYPWATWGEVTRDGTRIPINSDVTNWIEKVTVAVQPIRNEFGPLQVNSWYRPPGINRAVGGAPNSRHINGDAVDICPLKASIVTVQNYCLKYWGTLEGSRLGLGVGGVGKGAHRGFVHLDCRGFRVEWSY